jgi:hypothetical protein
MPGLLWFDWLAIAEVQKIANEHEPMASVGYVRGSAVEQDFRGKELSVVSWADYVNLRPLVGEYN